LELDGVSPIQIKLHISAQFKFLSLLKYKVSRLNPHFSIM
jgi:hypothetical protein